VPIRPENRSRYPADWSLIRKRILERAGDRCEGSPAYPDCRAPNGWYRVKGGEALVRIVLTIAHLDHIPENCDESNLRAWCQRCHLTYDAAEHAKTARRTRRAGRALGDLFQGGES
jgi:hypothetical protein